MAIAAPPSAIEAVPVGVRLAADVEYRPNRPSPYRARVRWWDPATKSRKSISEAKETEDEAQEWISALVEAAQAGINPSLATMPLADYGTANMDLALRGLELKTLDPYMAGWRLRVVPSLGHLPVRMITNGAVDRTVYRWIADEYSRSTVKNTIAVLVRVMEQAVRDGLIKVNPARVSGWQRQYQQVEDELNDPRALALPDWETLQALVKALVARSYGQYQGWGDVVTFAASTAARIGEVSGVRVKDIDTDNWIWTVRRQTTPARGGLVDKATKESAPARYPSSKRYGRWWPNACSPPATAPTPGSSSAPAADASPPPSCATPLTGTTSSPSSASSTFDDTTCATPG